MHEVQCFDGDGVVPPELKALMEENERLKERYDLCEKENLGLRETIRLQQQELHDLGSKLWDIQNIVNAKPLQDEVYPILSEDVAYKPMRERYGHQEKMVDWPINKAVEGRA
jgi:hypothetical protein